MAFKKAPKFVGKDLTLTVGRGDVRILDGKTYTDSRLEQYVKQGFLVRATEESASTPAQEQAVEVPVVPVSTTVASSEPPATAASDVGGEKDEDRGQVPTETMQQPEQSGGTGEAASETGSSAGDNAGAGTEAAAVADAGVGAELGEVSDDAGEDEPDAGSTSDESVSVTRSPASKKRHKQKKD